MVTQAVFDPTIPAFVLGCSLQDFLKQKQEHELTVCYSMPSYTALFEKLEDLDSALADQYK